MQPKNDKIEKARNSFEIPSAKEMTKFQEDLHSANIANEMKKFEDYIRTKMRMLIETKSQKVKYVCYHFEEANKSEILSDKFVKSLEKNGYRISIDEVNGTFGGVEYKLSIEWE